MKCLHAASEVAGFAKTGGPDVLELQNIDLPPAKSGEVRVRHSAIGVNFIDTYQRSGLYPVPLPSGLGLEAAGVVEAVGEKVTALVKGDRVAYCTGPLGAYAEANNVPADRLIRLLFARNRSSNFFSSSTSEAGTIWVKVLLKLL